MSSKSLLFSTTEKIVKEEINDMETKPNVAKEPITDNISENKIETVNKRDKPKSSKSKKDKSISNKSDKSRSLDKSSSLYKSRSTKSTETKDTEKTLDKSRSV